MAENGPDRTGNGWAALDNRFRRPLVTYFLRRVGDKSEAEDLTQEVFARLMRHPERQSGGEVDAYVFMIAGNLLKDRQRHRFSRRADRHQSLGAVSEFLTTPTNLVEDRDPERVYAARETLRDVLAALADMNERTREIFILARLEKMHQRDIAATLGISISTVEKHLYKALEHLTSRFSPP